MPDPNTNAGLKTFTAQAFATLPSAASVGVGARAFLSDATTNNQVGRGLTAIGGGTFQATVISNGTVWKIM